MSNQERLIQISAPRSPTCPAMRVSLGPIADKFFVIGALSSIVGIGWLGTHLWLTLNGQLLVRPNYADYRKIHILTQIYLFLGLFVLGFIAQAGPKLVGSLQPASHRTLLWIPCMFLGVVILFLMPELLVGQSILSGVFLSALYYTYGFRRDADPTLRATVGNLIFLGLAVFALSPFMNLQKGANAVIFFWCGLGAIIIGTGQQFIAAFLGGKRCSKRQANTLLLLVMCTAILLVVGKTLPVGWLWHIAGLCAVATVVYYVLVTKLYAEYRTATKDGLAIAFLTGYSWAIIGGLVLVWNGSELSDRVFHLWSIGWATPLILSVSGQVVGFMSGRNITRTKKFVGAIFCWQLVPIGRSLSYFLKLPPAFSWLVSVAASAVLIFWAYQLVSAELVILRRNLAANALEGHESSHTSVIYRRIIALFSRSH